MMGSGKRSAAESRKMPVCRQWKVAVDRRIGDVFESDRARVLYLADDLTAARRRMSLGEEVFRAFAIAIK
jgi:hypothetical protein